MTKPNPLLKFFFRLPVYLYRARLGWLLGHRFLMLTHRGRKTGQLRETVLLVLHYSRRRRRRESIVVARYAEKADWYRNIQASPAVRIDTAGRRFVPTQRFLSVDEAYDLLTHYDRRSLFGRTVLWVFGFRYERSEAGRRRLAEGMKMVGFREVR
jgi:deazaflavin-dependent oxidoreductase (nitroreductase family)